MSPSPHGHQPELSDGVVRLTPVSIRDADALFEADRDLETARRFDYPPDGPSRDASLRAIRRWRLGWTRSRLAAFAIRWAGLSGLIGMCEVRSRGGGSANVSYMVVPAERGRDVATRAVCLLSTFAFDQLGYARLEIRTEPDNHASARVAEKNGYMREGLLRGEQPTRSGRRDMVLYARLRTDSVATGRLGGIAQADERAQQREATAVSSGGCGSLKPTG